MDISNIISIVVALFGGGVVGIIAKAFSEKKKVNAEATNTNIKSLLEIDQRMNERMANLEERVAKVEQENYSLKSDNLQLQKETEVLKHEIKVLQKENAELKAENKMLKEKYAMLDK